MKALALLALAAGLHGAAVGPQVQNFSVSPAGASVPGQAITVTFEIMGLANSPTQWTLQWSNITDPANSNGETIADSTGIYPATLAHPTSNGCPTQGQLGPYMGAVPTWVTITVATIIPAYWPNCWGSKNLNVSVSDYSFSTCIGTSSLAFPMYSGPGPCGLPTYTPSPTAAVTPAPTALAAATDCGGAILDAVPVPNPNPEQIRVHLCGPAETLTIDVFTAGMTKIGHAEAKSVGPGWVAVELPRQAWPSNGLFYAKVGSWSGNKETSHWIAKICIHK